MDRTRVLVGYPPVVPDELVAKLQAVDPRVSVVTCHYEESGERRSARGAGALVGAAPGPELTAAQRAAFEGADVMLAFDLPVDVLAVAPDLHWVQAIGAGVDHYRGSGLDGVLVTNAAGVSAVPIAEFVIGRLLQVWKRFDELAALQRRHVWESTYGRMVAGSTIGVVGFGAIGSEVAVRARSFGMRVLGIRRSYRSGDTSPVADELFGPDALHEVLARCDAVVLSAPSTVDTHSMFDAAAFAAMKRGAVFCNVARGALVDEDALVAAVRSGRLLAAVLDVTRVEPLPPESPLWDTPGVLISPHSSTAPARYMEVLFDLFADNLGRHLRGEPLHNVVDLGAGY